MKILVCIKQVPDMESKFRIDAAGTWYADSDLAWRMNEYDEYAVEQAVQLKEQMGEACELTVLSIGPDRVKETMKKALAMGCDRGVHVKDDASQGKDSFSIASIIAAYIDGKGFDLVFTGMQSQDRGSAQVGVMVGALAGIATVSTVVDFAFGQGEITAKRELEGGMKAVVKLKTPALLTCQLGLNTPRYPTLPNIMKAKKKEIETLDVAALSTADSRLTTERMYFPEKKGGGLVLEGDQAQLADQLLSILRDKTAVLK